MLRDIELFLFAPIVVVLLVGLMLWFFFLRETTPRVPAAS